jgi:hypothetical protein
LSENHAHDWGGTTAVIAFVRKRVTPAALWGAIVGTGGMLVFAVTAWVGTQKNIAHLQELSAQQQAHEQKTDELLQQLVTGQAVMNGSVEMIKTEVDRQREWREKIEDEAEAPPHARRRR